MAHVDVYELHSDSTRNSWKTVQLHRSRNFQVNFLLLGNEKVKILISGARLGVKYDRYINPKRTDDHDTTSIIFLPLWVQVKTSKGNHDGKWPRSSRVTQKELNRCGWHENGSSEPGHQAVDGCREGSSDGGRQREKEWVVGFLS